MPYNAMKNRAFVPEEKFMREALSLAEEAFSAGEVPVGAVVVKDGKVIGRGRNRREEHQSVLGHAELEAMEQAVKMHFMAFQQFMKQTGGDIGLSLQLTTSYMAAMLKGSQEQNEKEEKLLKLLLPSGESNLTN